MDKLKNYKNYFELVDERTPFSLFKKYVFELIELAKEQQYEIEKQQMNKDYTSEDLPSLKGRNNLKDDK